MTTDDADHVAAQQTPAEPLSLAVEIQEAEQRLEQLRGEAQDCDTAYQDALDRGDVRGMAKARARFGALRDDEIPIAERASLRAQVAAVAARADAGMAALEVANAAAEEARTAEADARTAAAARNQAAIAAGTLYAWRYNEAVEADVYHLVQAREGATWRRTAARTTQDGLQAELAQAQAHVAAHRRRYQLTLDTHVR